MLRLVLALGAAAFLMTGAAAVIWLRTHVVPPGCEAPETLALVHHSLTGPFGLPSNVRVENIETHAGGYVAFRFACEGDLRGVDRDALAPGAAVPGKVYYISRLTDGGRRHEVTVWVQPLLKFERVQ